MPEAMTRDADDMSRVRSPCSQARCACACSG